MSFNQEVELSTMIKTGSNYLLIDKKMIITYLYLYFSFTKEVAKEMERT